MDKDLAQYTKDSKIKETIKQNNPTNQTKTIGVVIPIYNVAPYLRECLDSVINQTYKNLSIVLVNDGSTDNNESLNIAKEYVSKDSRFILIDKENGGLSSARNVGIEWFKHKYTTKLDSIESISHTINQDSRDIANNTGGGGVTLSLYTIINDNPYNIYRIYSLASALTPAHIDYIIFLDSDDYWRLNCIEECVKHSNGVDIVWFDFLPFFEQNSNKEWGATMQDCFHFESNMLLSGKAWLNRYIKHKLTSFYFAWSGLIDFNFLKTIQLYFLNGVIHEDHNFGCLLFLQSKNIYVLKDKFYYYRIRENSITTAKQTTQVPHCIKHIYDAFKDREQARQYHKKSSVFLMFLEFLDFLERNPSQNDAIIRKHFLPFYAEYCEPLATFEPDPLNVIPKLLAIEPYLKKGFKYRHKLRLTNPKKYNRLKPLFAIYDFLKNLKSNINIFRKKRAVRTIYIIVRDVVIWCILAWILLH